MYHLFLTPILYISLIKRFHLGQTGERTADWPVVIRAAPEMGISSVCTATSANITWSTGRRRSTWRRRSPDRLVYGRARSQKSVPRFRYTSAGAPVLFSHERSIYARRPQLRYSVLTGKSTVCGIVKWEKFDDVLPLAIRLRIRVIRCSSGSQALA